MPCSHSSSLGRRAFVAGGGGLLIGCTREASPPRRAAPTASTSLEASDAGARAGGDAAAHALFDTYPALAKTLPRVPLGRFPSAIERAASLAPGGRRAGSLRHRPRRARPRPARRARERRQLRDSARRNDAPRHARIRQRRARARRGRSRRTRAGRAPDARRTRAGAAKLRAIHDETFARARARAHARAHDADGWDLDPVYSGKALAALLDHMDSDPPGRGSGRLLFWNTMSSRAVAIADVPAAFRRFAR